MFEIKFVIMDIFKTLSLFLLVSLPLFSQETSQNKEVPITETKISYLDSIKKAFVKNDKTTALDSLWLKELTSLDLYNDFTADIQNGVIDTDIDVELPTPLLKERLAIMDAKSPFNIEYNQGLENIIKSFLKKRKKSFERLMALSEYYFPMFEEGLAKLNVPLEIKYLAIVESALNPKAVSRMGATGLWQFMYQTGKQYNLKIDSYVDERSDPLKATAAAAEYMSKMYTLFGDWDLVLASYNSGPGNVTKAIRRSDGQKNFWNIKDKLPKETQGYVPAFLATMYIYEFHKEHGIVPNRALLPHFATDTVMIKKQMSFDQISDLLDISKTELQLLNPSYKMNVVPYYNDQNHFLRLPQDKIALFTANEKGIYTYIQHEMDQREKPLYRPRTLIVKAEKLDLNSKYYTVKRGDNLTEIASKYNVTLADLKKWNKLRRNTAPTGARLKIHINDSVPEAKVETKTLLATAPKEVDSLNVNPEAYYVFAKGNNLKTIAKKYNTTIEKIMEWNNLSKATVQAGTVLQVMSKTNCSDEPSPRLTNIEYVVKKGDNLGTIAKKFAVSQSSLKQWNNLKTEKIALGSILIVAKDEIAIIQRETVVFKQNTYSKKTDSYFVQKGDTLYSIAKKHPGLTVSDIRRWNGANSENLKPGMKLKING
jgi:membrane-bound lytic murein transglycosylase D